MASWACEHKSVVPSGSGGSPTQAASALQPLVHSFPHAGLLTKILFAIGIIGIGFLAVPIFAGSSSYVIAETFGFKEGLSQPFHQAKVFYLIIIASAVVGVLMNFLGMNPFSALIYMVNDIRSEQGWPSDLSICANYPKALPFPTERFAIWVNWPVEPYE